MALEQQAKDLITTEEEYREFWLPLAIMEKIGLGEQALPDAF